MSDSGEAPPTYEEALANESLGGAQGTADGRVDFDLDSRLSKTLHRIVKPPPEYQESEVVSFDIVPSSSSFDKFPLRLNIVLQVVGSRGDVQPFLALASALQKCGHRVRLATHGKFSAFVQEAGVEFFSIGGDPEDLMAYMVKNPGLMPSMQSLQAGDIARKRKMIGEMLDGCWHSCIDPDIVDGSHFVADAIIANPPSFAHLYCAEALGIPVHMVFTMPWTGTTAFAHPLANVKGSGSDPKLANYMTYFVVEWITWQGLGDVINTWRQSLDLEPVPTTEGPMLAETLKIPHTYCWSPALVPKPKDWGAHINVSGFFFREAADYKPSEDLRHFLNAGRPPLYVGFGSIVLDDPARFCAAIIAAVIEYGERAIISPGWSRMDIPDDRENIFRLEDCPHEWLFKHVSMVIHHGGAGTTAIGLREARPTVVVPFFGDQPFWGNMIRQAGAGPEPIPQRQFTTEKLVEALRFCQRAGVRSAAWTIAQQIKQEAGVQAAVQSFHSSLPLERLSCDILANQPASWHVKLGGKRVKISRAAAEVLIQDVGFNKKNLIPYRSNHILITNRRWNPASGTASSLIGTGVNMLDGATGIFLQPREEYLRGRRTNASGNSRSAPASVATSRVRPASSTALPVHNDNQTPGNTSDEALSSKTQAIPPDDFDAGPSTCSSPAFPPAQSGLATAGSMTLASAKSAGKFFTAFTKGFLVEMPLATAEGFRNMPRLWGADVREYGAVSDWQSGGIVAGKILMQGVSNGFRDIVEHPVQGARTGGVLGAAKGVATGTASLLTSVGTAGVGLVAYPGQGICKTLHSLVHSSTAKSVAAARREEGKASAGRLSPLQRMAVVDAYHDLQRKEP